MRDSIVLCGDGEDAATAALWAEERAREARLTDRAAKAFGEKMRCAYGEACRSLIGVGEADPILKISLEPEGLTPRFEMVHGADAKSARATRAREALRARRERLAATRYYA